MSDRRDAIFALRDALYDRGHTLASFARAHGISYPHLVRIVHKYWGTGRQPPRGILGRRILRLLEEEIRTAKRQ
jgi:hypothetical protein